MRLRPDGGSFPPIRAVWKTGNTPSIPLFSKLSAEEKSLATGSCRIVRCCPKKIAAPLRNWIYAEMPLVTKIVYLIFRFVSKDIFHKNKGFSLEKTAFAMGGVQKTVTAVQFALL